MRHEVFCRLSIPHYKSFQNCFVTHSSGHISSESVSDFSSGNDIPSSRDHTSNFPSRGRPVGGDGRSSLSGVRGHQPPSKIQTIPPRFAWNRSQPNQIPACQLPISCRNTGKCIAQNPTWRFTRKVSDICVWRYLGVNDNHLAFSKKNPLVNETLFVNSIK